MLSRKMKLLAATAFVAIVAIGAAASMGVTSGEVPLCDSKRAKSLLRETIENNAYTNIVKVKLLDLDMLAEYDFVAEQARRRCMGKVVLNTGNESILYMMSRAKSDPSEIIMETNPLPFDISGMSKFDVLNKIGDATRDPSTKVQWFLLAAAGGNADAQLSIGIAYNSGTGVAEDNKEAIQWFRKAAEQGNNQAALRLAIAYHLGKGVEKDDKEALVWMRKSGDTMTESEQIEYLNQYR